MKLAQLKLDKIRDAWNEYFLEYAFCQKEINYNEEVATNYFGDVVSYMDDTFPVISKESFTNERTEHLGNAIALLQSIYVQQDLVDELMTMFALPPSGVEYKSPNRDLRNRLIGHPVSRRKGKLDSTVLLRYDNPAHEIIFVLYEASNGFSGKMQHKAIDEIIEEHRKYLHRNLDIMLRRIRNVLYKQKKELETIQKMLPDSRKTVRVIEAVFDYFEAFADNDYIYKKERLLEYWQRKKEHPRYTLAIRLFKLELKEHLKEKIADIENYAKEITLPEPYDPSSAAKIEIIYVDAETFKGKRRKYKKSMNYEFSKLHQKDHPMGLRYLLERFGERPLVGDELRHMQDNINNDLEYYAAYHYVKHLLKGIRSRMFYE